MVAVDVRAVVLDVGETIVDETRAWTRAAHDVGVTPLALMGVLGALVERGEPHARVWDVLGVDPPVTRSTIGAVDLYPDALPTLHALRAAGYVVAIAGNQPAAAEEQLRAAGVDLGLVASSARWGVAKPAPAFFARVLSELDLPPGQVLYVGDRLDNDVLPARAAGMRTAFLRRGPWGYVHALRPEVALADVRVDSLTELTRLLGGPPPG
ncbi:HAD family hydrolase [Cellulomonas dongxiuzhuiae]|uniref:HAD family hydrolase n=1 Tax=Cellulomonas dongxiuzhuiae TaxID=2819979 RepID=A0ABX8GPB0_9CELL|nr:HAD family hydrolase [Cellulomonas dongxiuzhuiae]MBO3096234.1 HAD family hydrolase [Cellulomonas dongxiuzhuiae]QWC17491.1 HAD family hydrolase [Cellulomonas dongxiuzhuiae]